MEDVYLFQMKALMGLRGMSQEDLAKKVGVQQPFISKLANLKQAGDLTLAHKIAGALDVSVPELVSKEPVGKNSPPDLLKIPIMNDPVAGGEGRIVYDEATSGIAWIPADQLPGRAHHNLRALRVKGRSMEPRIADGALVVIDLDDREVTDPNAIYAVIEPGDGITVKHVVVKGKKLLLVADNPDLNLFPPITVDLRNNPSPVVGRILWVGQAL